ncbi:MULTISPECIES: Zn-ribbon domain-containing OB-fold protein [unclassified Mycobacterium]|uniref:Zn-ribbon domain-containing OB-fold protein n=1 Tax=unclassified Mycobacterium TaxID=2642494 RepID=UPI0029C77DDE|nr:MULTISPECIES: OB-fold domain-containing protein [unclassified Mycobacterium]
MSAGTAADDPTPDEDSAAWWEALGRHELMFNRCRACEQPSLYARSFCPHCWSEDVELEQASGRATLYTWSVVHRNGPPFADRVPYVAAIVELAEGPRLMTIIEGCPVAELRADLELVVAYRDKPNGLTHHIFHPDGWQPD